MKKIYILTILFLLFHTHLCSQTTPKLKEEFDLPEELDNPTSLVVDQFDNFYVTGTYLAYKLDSQGKMTKVVGGIGEGDNNFRGIEDIRVEGLNIFIADSRNNRIVILDKYLNQVNQIQLSYQDKDLYPRNLCLTTSNQIWVRTRSKQGLFKVRSAREVPEYYSFNFHENVQLEASREDGIWAFSPKRELLKVGPYGGIERRIAAEFIQDSDLFGKGIDKFLFISFDEKLIYLTDANLKNRKSFIYPLQEFPIDIFFKNTSLFILLDNKIVEFGLK